MNRASFFLPAAASLLIVVALATLVSAAEPAGKTPRRLRAYIGTYTAPPEGGIFFADFDLETGKFVSSPKLAAPLRNPSFLALSPDRKFLYAVAEVSETNGKKTGAVAAYKIKPEGTLTPLNQTSSGGAGPCHVSVDPTGKVVLVANYGGGSVSRISIRNDGSLAAEPITIRHQGSSVNPARQKEPHAHSINPHPSLPLAYAADLGLDKVLIYRFANDPTSFTPAEPAFASVAPGSGPRHLAFHPSGEFAFVINELANTLIVFACDGKTGQLKQQQSITTLPEGFTGPSNTAEVVVHPSGKYVYGSNRGHDSIAQFSFDPAAGRLKPIGHISTQGKQPRNFVVDPTGKFLLAENQETGTIRVMKIDADSGQLSDTGEVLKVATPVCIRFVPLD